MSAEITDTRLPTKQVTFFNYEKFLRNPNLLKKAQKKKKLKKVIQDQQNEHPPAPLNTWSFTRHKKLLKKTPMSNLLLVPRNKQNKFQTILSV